MKCEHCKCETTALISAMVCHKCHGELVGVNSAWLPIDTAPKRGVVRLAHAPDDWSTCDGFMRDGKWIGACVFILPGPGSRFEFREYEVFPTHWMPRPEAPKECGWPSIGYVVDSNFARELERELALVTKERDACRDWLRAYLGEIEQFAKPHDIVRLKSECGL